MTLKKIKSGEYLYERGEISKRIRKTLYGQWNIESAEWVGAPPFAVGFRTKADAVRWLDDNIDCL